jgi:hypothetical protein
MSFLVRFLLRSGQSQLPGAVQFIAEAVEELGYAMASNMPWNYFEKYIRNHEPC